MTTARTPEQILLRVKPVLNVCSALTLAERRKSEATHANRRGPLDLTGHRYNSLTITRMVGKRKTAYFWEAVCDCGTLIVRPGGAIRHGDVKSCGCLLPFPPGRTADERFWEYTQRGADDECWLWVGSKNKGGYGQLSVNGKSRRAHRWSYEYFVGPIPEGLTIDHLCFNPPCVNPKHMEPVTASENTRRMHAHRRAMKALVA